MNNLVQLKLLMWKHFRFRKYYWWITVIEILFPMCLMFVIIKISHIFIETKVLSTPTYTGYKEHYFEPFWSYDVVLYTPKNRLTEAAMDFVQRNAEKFKKPVKIEHRRNENEIVLEISNSPSSVNMSGVIFLEYGNKLYYKIRDKNVYDTGRLFLEKENQIILPPFIDVYASRGFIALMSFLNQHFFKSVLSKVGRDGSLPKHIYYWEFPYPQYQDVSLSRVILSTVSGFVVVLSSLVLNGLLLYIIISEKTNGTKELLKTVGVPEKYVWFSSFLHSLSVGILVYSPVTILLKYDLLGINETVMYYVYGSVLWTCFLLFHIAQIAFCFMFCAIFNSISLAVTSVAVTTVSVSFLAYKFYQWRSTFFIHLSCFIPVGAFVQSFSRFAYYEMLGVPLPWKDIFANEANVPDVSVGFTFILFIFDTFLYLFLTYYFSVLNSSLHGFKMSPFFLLDKDLLKRYKNQKYSMSVIEKFAKKPENPFIETPSGDVETSLVLENLEKSFGYVQAVKNLNLTLYKNEIVVLLGFTGSGKTTTISLITGLTEPTKGKVLFKGIDLLKNLSQFRKNIGVCLQDDCLFPYMSVLDHLTFFGMLKGATEDDAVEEARKYLIFMNIESNADETISVSSKVVKRKLCLSMSLMGACDVLILDEPTKGLNTSSKRKIWTLLKELRKNRTIISTSSSIDEAVTIGDRIAVMDQGLIVAHGSTEFFKRTFGVGYRLKLQRKKIKDVVKTKDVASQLIDFVQKAVPGSKTERRSPSEIVFRLSSTETAKFPELIRSLESKKSALNIEHLVISGLSLDHLFLKLGGKSVFDIAAVVPGMKPVKKEPIVIDHIEGKVEGLNLELLQCRTLFIKKWLYVYRNIWTFILRVVLPTIFMLFLLRGVTKFEETDPPLELSLKGAYPNAIVLILQNDNSNWYFFNWYLAYLREMGARIKILSRTNSLTEDFLNYAKQSITAYRREVILALDLSVINKTRIDIFYNKWTIHSLPIAVNTAYNAVHRYFTKSEAYSMIPVNHPIKPVNVSLLEDKYNTDISEQSPVLTVWFILLAFFTIDLLEYFAFPVKVERISGFKQIQHLSSVSLYTYWMNNFIFDYLLYLIIIVCRLILFIPFDYYDFFGFKYHIFIFLLIILLYCASGLLFTYVISFSTYSTSGSYLFFFFFNIICACTSFMYYTYETSLLSGPATSSIVHIILTCSKYLILLVPPLNFSLAVGKLIMAWRVNHMVDAYAQLDLSEKLFQSTGIKYLSYLEYTSIKNPNGILEELQFLAIDLFLYASILYVIDVGLIIKLIYSIKYRPTGEIMETSKGPPIPVDVLEERKKVEAITKLIRAEPSTKNVLIVESLQKIFERLLRPPLIAVNNVSFVVEAGKCFGILGPKESGKTTTFKILTGEILPTTGDSWILNVKLSEDRNKYFSQTGYCAETNCFLEELTGKETLNMIASLKGVTFDERETIVDKWLSVFGLQAIENKKCGSYSDGDRRKLCTILALIGDPSVVFLDGPTIGIDPISRQTLYNILIQGKSAGQAIALATSSIEECAILCDRFTILVKGNMKFIGTAEQLKTKYGQGLSLSLTLREPTVNENEDVHNERIEILKKLINTKFQKDSCRVIKETQVLLRYHIKNKIPLADAFQRMEEVKKIENIIVDYLLTQRSLEEIYLSFIEDSV